MGPLSRCLKSVCFRALYCRTNADFTFHRHSRNPAILPPSLTISSFPLPPTTTDTTPTLHAILRLLVPITVHLNLPLNLHSWSAPAPGATPRANDAVHFAPHSENEDLHSGALQLPAGSLLTILEAGVQEGSSHPRTRGTLSVLPVPWKCRCPACKGCGESPRPPRRVEIANPAIQVPLHRRQWLRVSDRYTLHRPLRWGKVREKPLLARCQC